jgi:2-aminoadipate transaminase
MRRLYAARLAALLDALRRDMPPGTRWTEPRSGHLVWVTLPPGIDPERLEHAARDRGVVYTRGETFHADGRGGDSLALSFAPLDPRTIAEGVARLGAAVREQIVTRRVPGQVRPAAVRSGRGCRPAGRSLRGAR